MRHVIVLLASALASCFAHQQAPQPPQQVTSAVFLGMVAGPDGTLVEGGEVELFWIDPKTGESKRMAWTRTNQYGNYWLRSNRVGLHRLVASLEGASTETVEFEIEPGRSEHRADIQLQAESQARISGILLDATTGLQLEEIDLALLFPALFDHDEHGAAAAEDGITEVFPFTGDSDLGVRSFNGSIPPGGFAPARVDIETGRFEIDVPHGFAGELVLRFRGEVVSWQAWYDGDAPVELQVETAALRATLGDLEIAVPRPADAGDEAVALRVFRRDAGTGFLPDEWDLEPLPKDVARLRLRAIPAGPYRIVAECKGHAAKVVSADVPAQQKASAEVAWAAPSQGRLILSDVPQDADLFVEMRNRDGILLASDIALAGAAPRAAVSWTAGPIGEVVCIVAGNRIKLDLASGENAAKTIEMHPIESNHLRFRVDVDANGPVPTSLEGHFTLMDPEGWAVDEWIEAVPLDVQVVDMELRVVTGHYSFSADLGIPKQILAEEVSLDGGPAVILLP